jgi:DNA-binding PadR family transcriptional regulator
MQKYYAHLRLAPIVLVILAAEDEYGYAILQRVREF